MPDTISSNLFNVFFNAYERGVADFALVDGVTFPIPIVKVKGGPLSGLKDLASRLPIISAAFLTQNGTQPKRDFRCLFEGPDVKEEELKVHFRHNGFWFYFSGEESGELRLRLGDSGNVEADKMAEFRVKLDKHFKDAYEKEPRNDPRRPIKFTMSYLLGETELKAATRLAAPDDKVTGRIKPYWRAYRNVMIRPVLRALEETFQSGK
jgi:hypothetical protein